MNARNGDDWMVTIRLHGHKTKFKLDTGAQCNIIPQSIHAQDCSKMEKSKASLVTYGGQCLKPKGKCLLLGEYKGKYYDIECQIMEDDVQPLLGLKTCTQMGLIKRVATVTSQHNDIKDRYADVFTGLGCIEGEQHIKIKSDAQPATHAPRRVPVALRNKVMEELERMEKLGVIERLLEIKTETRNDSILPIVKSFVLNGWPDQAKLYWDYCDELTVEDDVHLKGNRIVIPQSKQRFMLHKVNTSHQGIEKTK